MCRRKDRCRFAKGCDRHRFASAWFVAVVHIYTRSRLAGRVDCVGHIRTSGPCPWAEPDGSEIGSVATRTLIGRWSDGKNAKLFLMCDEPTAPRGGGSDAKEPYHENALPSRNPR